MTQKAAKKNTIFLVTRPKKPSQIATFYGIFPILCYIHTHFHTVYRLLSHTHLSVTRAGFLFSPTITPNSGLKETGSASFIGSSCVCLHA